MRSALYLLGIMAVLVTRAPARGADQVADVADLKPLPMENLGVPVRTMRRAGEFLVPKPEGKGWWFLTSYNPVSRNPLPCQICIVDLNTKEVRLMKKEPVGALHNMVAGQDGMYYLGHYAKMGLWQFNPADGGISWIDFPGNRERILPCTMLVAPNDGKIYLGTASGSARVVEFDPDTRRFRDFGVQGPAHASPRYIYYLACDDNYVYSAAGKNPWYLVAANRKTMEQKILARDMAYLSVHGVGERCTARITPQPKDKRPAAAEAYRLRDGGLAPPDAAKDKEPPRAKEPRPEMLLTGASPDSEGKAQIAWRLPGGPWEHVDLTGIQTVPWGFRCLKALPDGRLLGAPKAYEDFFVYDPRARRFTILGKSPQSCSFIEVLDNKIYILGYPGANVCEVDLSRPWTYKESSPDQKEPDLFAAESNPRMCYRWSMGVLPAHHVHGCAVGSDGLLYFGGHAERSAVGGGIGWWDPVARKPGGLREPFLVQDCAGMTAARGGQVIVYSSHPVADPTGKIPRPKEAKLFVLDTATKQIVLEATPMPGMTNCGPVLGIDARVYGAGRISDQAVFYVFDLDEKKTVHSQSSRESLGPNLALGPDGNIYTFIGDALARMDPKTFRIGRLGTVENAGRIEFVGQDLYLTGAEELRRVRDVPGIR